MKYILALIALVTLVGVSMGLNPQPEPPARHIGDAGTISVIDNVLYINLGQVSDVDAALQEAIDILSTKHIPQSEVVLIANGVKYPLVKIVPTVYASDDVTSLLATKI